MQYSTIIRLLLQKYSCPTSKYFNVVFYKLFYIKLIKWLIGFSQVHISVPGTAIQNAIITVRFNFLEVPCLQVLYQGQMFFLYDKCKFIVFVLRRRKMHIYIKTHVRWNQKYFNPFIFAMTHDSWLS